MNPTKIYNYLKTARATILDAARPLTHEQYMSPFPIGPGSLAAILSHTLAAESYYILRLRGRDVPPFEDWPISEDAPPPFAQLESAWKRQADETLDAINTVSDWNAKIHYTIDDEGQTKHIAATATDIVTQLILHEVHHRAQALHILRQFDVKTDDIDYNLLTYTITDG